MADEVTEHEARLVALRARRQRWANKLAAVEDVRGESVARGQARNQLKRIDAEVAAAEMKLRSAQTRAVVIENREIDVEENMSADLDEICKLAASCDEHAASLGAAVRALQTKIVAMRQSNGRGPGGERVNLSLKQAADPYFDGTPLRSRPWPASRHKNFTQLISGWVPMLTPSSPEPTPPSPPERKDGGFVRREGEPSEPGLPRMN